MQYREVRSTLEGYLEDAQTKLELWRNVKRLTKKNGEDFARFGANFEGAKVYTESWSDYEEINVSGRTASGKWVEDKISLEPVADANTDPERVTKLHDYSYERYHLTVEETFEKINKRIRYYEVVADNYRLELEYSEELYNLTTKTVEALYNEALKELVDAGYKPTHKIDTPSMLYQMHKMFETSFPPHMSVSEEEVEVSYR